MKRHLITPLLSLALVSLLSAAEPLTINLWPEGAPEPAGYQPKPEEDVKKDDGIRRVGEVSVPTITIYQPEKPNGTAVIVCPGGGYSILALEHEGTQVCEWLNTLGVTGILLKYRVPKRDPLNPSKEPLQDAQRAMGIVRHRAAEWNLKPDRIGILGFSAGGHLCVSATLRPNERTYTQDAKLDVEDATPSFSIPVYPAYLVEKDNQMKLLDEIKVSAKAPPICLVHAHDDKLSSSGSALLYLEYKRLNLPAELHIYTKGGHGYGMKKSGQPVNEWPARVGDWMKSMGWLE
jgi:acetyl esterase/lipase